MVCLAAGVPVGLVVVVAGAWAIDLSGSSGEVVRNVEVAGRAVGGIDRGELGSVVDELARRYAEAGVRVRTPDGDLLARADEMGLSVDGRATGDAVLAVGRTGPALVRPFAWVLSLVAPRRAPVTVTVDEAKVRAVVAERDPTGRRAPVEPSLVVDGGELAVAPGEDGRGLDAAELADLISEAAATGDLPIVVEAEAGPISPRFSGEDAGALLDEARRLTAEPLALEAVGSDASVSPEVLRSWLRSVVTEDGLALGTDAEKVLAGLAELLPEAGRRPVDAGFEVRGGQVAIVPGRDGTGCCGEESAGLVLDALRRRPPRALSLPLRTIEPERSVEDAAALGIRTEVSSFTTSHKAGESRVANIHRIADLVRGVVIEPGETFSVNQHVGRRTRAKGFVPAGVIYQGEFTEDVGGGISQFATTLFNAAFFAGLDFEAYQSHSIYISRYPYGREATLSFPRPDLVIRNTTPYGVLISTSYTDSSITVSMYSTAYVTVEQSGQTSRPAGQCTRVTTERTRTYAGGRRHVDTVFATYRPAEGVDC